MKILIGGSPCTHWSIAQNPENRETEAKGLGWELFRNYLIAKEKFKPDYFLYENNKSAAYPIKDQIAKELGVELQYINSALVSAQNRQRFYAHNIPNVEQPEDRELLLKDILESGVPWQDQSYCITSSYRRAVIDDTLKRHRKSMVAEPVIFQTPRGFNDGGCKYDKSPTLTSNAWEQNNKLIMPVSFEDRKESSRNRIINKCKNVDEKARTLTATSYKGEQSDGMTIVALPYNDNPTTFNVNPSGKGMNGAVITTDRKSRAVTTNKGEGSKIIIPYNGGEAIAYRVENGIIEIKDKQYPIRLPDGYYIIRKLSPIECERLQTMPDNYTDGISNSRRYKCLGNGWTAEVIIHILSHIPYNGESVEVLSMYDGIATGRYCMDQLGWNIKTYKAYEIDKYAIQVAINNYPDIIQCGDAFDIRDDDWIY